MSSETVRAGFDCWVDVGKPFTNHPNETHYRLRNNQQMAYVWFRSPAPLGAVITSATLTVAARGASTGSRSLIIHRIGESWIQGRTHWNNRPAQIGTGINHPIGNLVHGQRINIDVTSIVQLWSNGAGQYGFRINTSTNSLHYLCAFNSTAPPTLTVEWEDRPTQPTNLKPTEGATGKTHPHLTFDYLDVSGDTELGAVQVQIAATENGFTSPGFDSGEVATDSSGLDLAETSFAGLAPGVTQYWRVRAMDSGGLWSVWSEIEPLTHVPKVSVTITNLGEGAVFEPSPPIIWDVTGGTQTKFRVFVFEAADLTRSVYDSRERQGSDDSFTIPNGVLQDGVEYRVRVWVWDNVNREATPGDGTWAAANADFTVQVDATVGPVSSLTVSQKGVTPMAVIEWERSTTPDGFVLLRDGKVIREWDDPADVFVGGTTYRYGSYGARPNFTHTYEVRAIVNGRQSVSNIQVDYAVPVEGIWLIDREREIEVTLWGDDEGSWEMPDDASVYQPVGSTEVVRVVSGLRGLEGELSGILAEGWGKSFVEMERDLYTIKSYPNRTVQIVAADVSFNAIIGNLTVAPKPQTRDGEVIKQVSFSFWQVGGPLPFRAI